MIKFLFYVLVGTVIGSFTLFVVAMGFILVGFSVGYVIDKIEDYVERRGNK